DANVYLRGLSRWNQQQSEEQRGTTHLDEARQHKRPPPSSVGRKRCQWPKGRIDAIARKSGQAARFRPPRWFHGRTGHELVRRTRTDEAYVSFLFVPRRQVVDEAADSSRRRTNSGSLLPARDCADGRAGARAASDDQRVFLPRVLVG